MPLQIVRNDITKMNTDAIVNAANKALKMGGGVCGAIFSAAGPKELQEECDGIGGCEVGGAVITGGYRLPAKYIIHSVGPIWRGGDSGEPKLLHDCYTTAMGLALKHGCKSIAFPLISTGIYGYPKDQAFQIAISAIGQFLLKHDMMVYLTVFDKNAYLISEKLFSSIERFIDDKYVEDRLFRESRRGIEDFDTQVLGESVQKYRDMYDSFPNLEPGATASPPPRASTGKKAKRNLEDVLSQLDESFSQMLLRLIDEKGLSDVEAYKRANVDRRLFSKIRSRKDYNPSKSTAVAFAISLGLNLDETRDLLSRAGYALTHSSKFDIIIEYFITEGNYNIHEVNEALFTFNQTLLGA